MTTEAAKPIQAVLPWGATSYPPKLISHRENAVYDVMLPQGRAALRLHRPGYRTQGEILSELQWTKALAEHSFPAPRPLQMLDGGLVHTLPDGQMVTVIAWMQGSPVGQGEVAFDNSKANLATLYHDIGGLLAQLHNTTDALTLPEGFSRPYWNRDGLTGDDPLWGRYWDAPGLSPVQVRTICEARNRARGILAEFDDEADFGLIHADALRENVFRNKAGLSLIDFDDAGFGYRMYELGSCVTQSVDEPAYDEIVLGLLDGYATERTLSHRSRLLFQMFAMLRSFSALGWTIPRLAHDHPKLSKYIRRAMTQAEIFLSDGKIG